MKQRNYTRQFSLNNYINPQYLLPKTDDPEEKRNHLEKIGFLQKVDGRTGERFYRFEANTFANYLGECLTCVADKDENLYIYNRLGHYEIPTDKLFGRLMKYLMGQYDQLWSKKRETEALDSFLRSVPKDEEIVFNKEEKVNLLNGLLNLETLELESHSSDTHVTIQIPMEYAPNAASPRFDQFLQEITGNDEQLIGLLQEITGYCLCHHTKAEKAFLFYGNGCNGKSVMAKLITQLVGPDNVAGVPLSKFGENFALESLVDKNLNIAAENELSSKFNSESFKAIVSGDSVNIQRKYMTALQCSLSCKMLFLVNSLPDTADFTYGYFRRLLIVPFNRTFSVAERDENLLDKLLVELPGVLNWAVQGLSRLRANGYRFSSCAVVDATMQTYKNQQNPTGEFFREYYEPSEGGQIKKSEIYDEYAFWMQQNGAKPVSRRRFWTMLKAVSEELGSGITLDYKRLRGIDHLIGYAYCEEHKPQAALEISF